MSNKGITLKNRHHHKYQDNRRISRKICQDHEFQAYRD